VKSILFEGLLVTVAGGIFAFSLNALSPRGLALTRNYFPQDQIRLVHSAGGSSGPPGSSRTNDVSPLALLMARLREQGIEAADGQRVATWFHDPRHDEGLVVFVDARDDQHYQEGHIPSAYQLDNFHPFDYLATVLPACQLAEQVVVYCNGGNCDDSLGVATVLVSANIPKEKIAVYLGGITEWSTNGLPIEVGPRNSGQVSARKP
jgi:rhodanese-related sulfurtransferase